MGVGRCMYFLAAIWLQHRNANRLEGAGGLRPCASAVACNDGLDVTGFRFHRGRRSELGFGGFGHGVNFHLILVEI